MSSVKYKTYDELVSLMAERDKLVRQTFKIDRATLRERDGVSDQIGVAFD